MSLNERDFCSETLLEGIAEFLELKVRE